MPSADRLITVTGSRALDAQASEKYGVSTLLLMENAGRAVAEEALASLKGRKGNIAVFCGRGNNGGDGLVAARHLLAASRKPDIYLAGEIAGVEGEVGANLHILLNLKQKIVTVTAGNLRQVTKKACGYSLIVDALLGSGLSGEVRGIYRGMIGLINLAGAYVLSVDVPSGLDGTSGKTLGACVKADKTVTFIAKKRGMVTKEGKRHCGSVVVRNLGLPL